MVKESLPFRNKIVKLKLLGNNLLETLEIAVRSNGETSRGKFLQYSGIIVVYDYEEIPNQRVLQARVKCAYCFEPTYMRINPHDECSVISSLLKFNGGDGHMFNSENDGYEVMVAYDIDIFMSTIKKLVK